jgi:nucleoid-associated protein YgaU
MALSGALTGAAGATSLRGTTRSLDLQNREARRHDFTFLRSSSQVRQFVDQGYLAAVEGNADFVLHRVSFPYARPEVKLFITRLARQYRAACGEQLVVTSLTRPRNRQPWNASPRSVHPTGMAVDLRRTWHRACRTWLEQVLLSLEDRGVLEASYERGLPHYHVAVFPRQYASYVARLGSRNASLLQPDRYIVLRGDTLWRIAHRHATSVDAVKRVNGLRSNRIFPGQVLTVPSAR